MPAHSTRTRRCIRFGSSVAVAAAIAAILLVAPALAGGGPGHLDRSFGDGGISVVTKAHDTTGAAAIGRKGRIVVAGHQTIARLLPDGRIDRSFGEDGLADAGFSSTFYPLSVAIAWQGGIFAAGEDCSTVDDCVFAVSHL